MVALSFAIALGWRSMSTMSRLLFMIAEQTKQATETLLVVNANFHNNPDVLLFNSTSATVNGWNGFTEQKPSAGQINRWNDFLRLAGTQDQAHNLLRIPNVKYYYFGLANRTKVLPAETRNIMLGLVQNEWLTFFDDDDMMHRRRIEFVIGAIQNNPDVDAINMGFYWHNMADDSRVGTLLKWWYDPLVASDVSGLTKDKLAVTAKLKAYFESLPLRPLDAPLKAEVDALTASVPTLNESPRNWIKNLQVDKFPDIAESCRAVLDGAQPPPLDNADPDLLHGNAVKHANAVVWNVYVSDAWDAERDAFRRVGPEPHVCSANSYGFLHVGWLTIKADVARKVVQVDIHDDGTYQFWRMLRLCRKIDTYYNILGLYLRPRAEEY